LFVAISCSGGDLTIDADSQSAVASQLHRHIDDVIMAGDGPSVLLTSKHLGNPCAGSSVTSDPFRGFIINDLGAGAVGGFGNPSLSPGRATGTVPNSVVSTSIPLSPGRGLYLPTQSQVSYRSASSSPSARRPSSGFDVDNEEADAREDVVVVDWHADVRASATMLHYNDDDADNGDFDDTIGEILGASFIWPHIFFTLISLLVPSTPTSTSLALTFSLPLPLSPLPFPLFLLLLLLGSPSEIQEFSTYIICLNRNNPK